MVKKASEGIIVIGPQNDIMYINELAKQMLEVRKDIGFDLHTLIPPENIQVDAKGEQIFKIGNRMLSARVEQVHFDDTVISIFYILDITKRLQQEEKVQCLESIIDSVNEGVIACDSSGNVFVYNNQIAKLEGNSKDEVLGRHYFDVWGLAPKDSYFLSVLRTGKPRKDEPWNHVANTGHEINYVHSTYPVFKNDKVLAVYCLSRNVSRVRQLLEKTVELQEKLFPAEKGELLSNGTRFSFKDIIGRSEAIQKTISEGIKAAQSLAPIMIYGETGTGKELFVQSIHNASINNNVPFVAINCAAIPETLLESILFGTTKGAFTGAESTSGLFEQAGKGTLFLDEINSMPITLQAKMLRVIQEKTVRRIGANTEVPVHCRILSSTNEDPWRCVSNGRIRQDLYYRLAGIYIRIPPLRERHGDVELLAKYFLKKYARVYGKGRIKLSEQMLELLISQAWQGNVRELEYVIESSVAMMDIDEDSLLVHHLPPHLRTQINNNNQPSKINNSSQELTEKLRTVEKNSILIALETHNWNISQAARALGIKRQNLQYKIRQLKISKS